MYEKCEYIYVRSIEVFTLLNRRGENPIVEFINIYNKKKLKEEKRL